MNIIHKHRISFSSKALATVLLSVLLNVASVWGQTNTIVNVTTPSTGTVTTAMECGKTYKLSASGSDVDPTGHYTRNKAVKNGNTRVREFTFTPAEGQQIKIDSFAFIGVAAKIKIEEWHMKWETKVTLTETRASNSDEWGNPTTSRGTASYSEKEGRDPIYEIKIDRLKVNGITYGGTIPDYGNEYLSVYKDTAGFIFRDDTATYITDNSNSVAWTENGNTRTKVITETKTVIRLKRIITPVYTHRFVVPEMVLNNGVTFTFTEETGLDTLLGFTHHHGYPPANFTAYIHQLHCCPEATSPVNNAVVTTDDVQLSWDNITGATGYKVYYKRDGGAETAVDVATNTYTIPAAATGTYTWRIVPIVDENERTFCTDEYVFHKCDNIPGLVTGMIPADHAVLGSRWLSWNPAPCASEYTVYVAPEMDGINNLIRDEHIVATTTNTQILLPTLAQGDYFWTVVPRNAIGSNVATTPQLFTIEYSNADEHVVSASTQGKEFYFSLMENGFDSHNGGGAYYAPANDIYTAVISPKYSTDVTFYYYETGRSETFHVNAGETKAVILNKDEVYHVGLGDQYKRRTVRVTSDQDISLYIANEANYSFDASIVLPRYALGSDYRIQTYPNGSGLSYFQSNYPCFMIIAPQDSTFVRIAGPHSAEIDPPIPTHNNGLIMLNEGDSYFVKSASPSSGSTYRDLSGLTISVVPRAGHPEDTCKTVAVFNGNVVTGVPTTKDNNYDHLVEQAFPIPNWGKKFAITSTVGYGTAQSVPNSDYIRITSNEPNTTITIKRDDVADNTIITLADAGQTAEFNLPYSYGSCYIETDKPVGCYLYQRSTCQSCDGGKDNTGDPSMVWISPIERGIEEITFSTFAAVGINENDHFVNIVIPADALENGGKVILTSVGNSVNEDITSGFTTLSANSNYKYIRKRIKHGTYTLESTAGGKMVVHIYGLGEWRGYAYNAGCAAVPYKSNFQIGESLDQMGEISMFPADYHFCTNEEYFFGINSNATTIDSIEWNFQDGTKKMARLNNQGQIENVSHIISNSGEYEILAAIYSTVYDYMNCQNTVVIDSVKDYMFVFISHEEVIKDTICKGEDYHYTYYEENGQEVDGIITAQEIQESVVQNRPIEKAGYSKYGCERIYILDLKVYGEMQGGTIRKEEEGCAAANFTITKLLNNTPATMANPVEPSVHYQWQKCSAYTLNGNTATCTGEWIDISGETGPSHIVAEPGLYRREYISECGTAYSNEIYVASAGSYIPSIEIGGEYTVCEGDNIGGYPIGGTPGDNDVYLSNGQWYIRIPGNSEATTIGFQWQYSTDNANWVDITGETGFNYNINGIFNSDMYYRRLITNIGSCDINLDMGVFHLKVNPLFTYECNVVHGCSGSNNARVGFTITGGSGEYSVYYGPENSRIYATNNNGVYEFTGLTNSTATTYSFTIEDIRFGCTQTKNVTINPPPALSIGNITTALKVCQGASINVNQIPLPSVSGGTAPYNITLDLRTLNIGNNVPSTSNQSFTISVEPGLKTVYYTVEDVAGCTKTIAPSSVQVNSNPALELSTSDVTTCDQYHPDGQIGITITNTPTLVNTPQYTYTLDNTVHATTGEQQHTFNNVSQGEHTIRVTDNNGCSTEVNRNIGSPSGITSIIVDIVDAGNTTIFREPNFITCPTKNITLVVRSITENGVTYNLDSDANRNRYEYSFSSLTTADGGSEVATELQPMQQGVYTYSTIPMTCGQLKYRIRVKSSETSCETYKDITNVYVEDGTVPTISGSLSEIEKDVYFCTSFTLDIDEVNSIKTNVLGITEDNCVGDEHLTVSISNGPHNINNQATVAIPITVTDLCTRTATTSVTVRPRPWPKFKINNANGQNCYCHSETITLTAVLENGSSIEPTTYEGSTYQWYKGDVALSEGGRYSGTTTKQLTITSADKNTDDDTYTLKISRQDGCEYSANIRICVHPAIEFHLE